MVNSPTSKSPTILFAGGGTGGHLMPALAIGSALRRAHPEWRVVLVGAQRGVEAKLLPTRDFPFHLLAAEPIYRRQWWKNVRWPFLAIKLLRQVRQVLDEERPALVVGTGGYASGPVVWLAARRGIPTAILEQDAYPGLTTRWLAKSVKLIFLGSHSANEHLKPSSSTEVIHTGSPITPPEPGRRAAALARFGLEEGHDPVLLISCGSQGSLAINRLVAEWLGHGGGNGLTVLWATGRASFEEFRHMAALPRIQVFEFLDPIADAYAIADLAVCRAGMMTIAELAAWGIPAILIPLPTAANDHQTANARSMSDAGAAVYVGQGDLTWITLGEKIHMLVRDVAGLAEMRRRALSLGRPGAVGVILERLEGLVSRSSAFPNSR
ncbi:MAG: UDP-N-acetylglucosamine--N-acetylmuramyl-(pentapeptide) pyrophosphoryl-undecaprenol N-acetylglucosamine transferase [Gemmatimonadota bacterium]